MEIILTLYNNNTVIILSVEILPGNCECVIHMSKWMDI